MSAAEILERIRSLEPAERRRLFEQVWIEFSEDLEDTDENLSPERIAELERRAENLRQHPEKGIPLEKVRAELKERLASLGAPNILTAALCHFFTV